MTGLRGRLASAQPWAPLTAALLTVPEPAVAAVLAGSGFDIVIVDAEHGLFTPASISTCRDAAALAGAAVVVRVAGDDPAAIRLALETGADGILVPGVSSPEAAASAVAAARFPPAGRRGVGITRANAYGAELDAMLTPERSPAVLVMIENRAGIERAHEIVRTPGLDGILVGPIDLAVDLGAAPRLDAEGVRDHCRTALGAAVDAGICAGIAGRAEDAAEWRDAGAGLLACLIDVVALRTASVAALERVRSD